jgi:hypothetical protein
MRDYINYVDNNLFSGLRNGVAQRNVRTMIIKACIGFLGNISPNLLKNVYLSRILNDTMFISEIDLASVPVGICLAITPHSVLLAF